MTKLRLVLGLATAIAVLPACEKKAPEKAEPTETTPAGADTTATEEAKAGETTGHEGMQGAHSAHEHMKHKVMPSAEIDEGASIYQLDVELVAQDGEPRDWEDFSGKPLIITMIYSSCTTACPLIVQEVKNILKAANTPDQPVLLVSMDPERDDPKALREMKERHHLGDSWTLVRPSKSDVREIAAALGIRYRQLPSGDFNHSQVISVLDGKGVIVARAEGLGPQRSDVTEALTGLSE